MERLLAARWDDAGATGGVGRAREAEAAAVEEAEVEVVGAWTPVELRAMTVKQLREQARGRHGVSTAKKATLVAMLLEAAAAPPEAAGTRPGEETNAPWMGRTDGLGGAPSPPRSDSEW